MKSELSWGHSHLNNSESPVNLTSTSLEAGVFLWPVRTRGDTERSPPISMSNKTTVLMAFYTHWSNVLMRVIDIIVLLSAAEPTSFVITFCPSRGYMKHCSMRSTSKLHDNPAESTVSIDHSGQAYWLAIRGQSVHNIFTCQISGSVRGAETSGGARNGQMSPWGRESHRARKRHC